MSASAQGSWMGCGDYRPEEITQDSTGDPVAPLHRLNCRTAGTCPRPVRVWHGKVTPSGSYTNQFQCPLVTEERTRPEVEAPLTSTHTLLTDLDMPQDGFSSVPLPQSSQLTPTERETGCGKVLPPDIYVRLPLHPALQLEGQQNCCLGTLLGSPVKERQAPG